MLTLEHRDCVYAGYGVVETTNLDRIYVPPLYLLQGVWQQWHLKVETLDGIFARFKKMSVLEMYSVHITHKMQLILKGTGQIYFDRFIITILFLHKDQWSWPTFSHGNNWFIFSQGSGSKDINPYIMFTLILIICVAKTKYHFPKKYTLHIPCRQCVHAWSVISSQLYSSLCFDKHKSVLMW